MSTPEYKTKTNVADERIYRCRLLGVNGADPTKEFGPGLTVTRTSEGVYKFSFNDNPGTFIGIGGWCVGDTTPGDVKAYVLTRDTFVAPSGDTDAYIEVTLWDSGSAADIIDTEYLDISFVFSENSEVA